MASSNTRCYGMLIAVEKLARDTCHSVVSIRRVDSHSLGTEVTFSRHLSRFTRCYTIVLASNGTLKDRSNRFPKYPISFFLDIKLEKQVIISKL